MSDLLAFIGALLVFLACCGVGRVDISSLVCRWIITGVLRRASHEDVLMVGDFLHDFQVAMAWIPSSAPEDVFDVVFQEYLGYAREDFSAQLVCLEVRNGVQRRVRLQRCVCFPFWLPWRVLHSTRGYCGSPGTVGTAVG